MSDHDKSSTSTKGKDYAITHEYDRANKNVLTDNEVPKHFNDILFTLLVSTEEVVPSASSKHLAAVLICPSQLLVGWAFLEGILLTKPMAPERSMVGVNGIVRTTAN
jgi:hypothetical protein